MNVSHEERRCQSSKDWSQDVDPQVSCVSGSVGVTLMIHVSNLICGLGQTEGWIKASSTNCTCSLDHCQKCESNCCCLQDTVLALLSLLMNLTKDDHAEEEGAPELKEKDSSKAVVVKAASCLVVRTQESWSSKAEVSIYDAKVSADDLRSDNHHDQHDVLQEGAISSVDRDRDSGVEHSS